MTNMTCHWPFRIELARAKRRIRAHAPSGQHEAAPLSVLGQAALNGPVQSDRIRWIVALHSLHQPSGIILLTRGWYVGRILDRHFAEQIDRLLIQARLVR